mmetsp:Transcript_2666/g.8702  ORF Transcript_2666/g.8702 Transcript_2666/m.8702 type:complete len:217 (-) Transcript_2666:459-1109(-)
MRCRAPCQAPACHRLPPNPAGRASMSRLRPRESAERTGDGARWAEIARGGAEMTPPSCRPSGVRRSAVAVATSTVRMAELICSAAKSLEPSGAHASASGSSMVAGVYLRRASAKLTMSIFLFEKSSKYTIAFSGSGMCTPSACSALSLDPATLPRDTVFEDRVATSTRETDPSGSMSWQTTPPVHCPLPWLETATVLQSGEGSRLSGPGPTPTSQT